MAGISSDLREAFIEQAKFELKASLTYEHASLWFDEKHLKRIASFLRKEADSEKSHFRQLLDYVSDRGELAKVRCEEFLGDVNWEDERAVFNQLFAMERENYEKLVELFRKAREANDYDAENMINKMLEEQVLSVHEWEGHVTKLQSFTAMPGLIWHFDALIE